MSIEYPVDFTTQRYKTRLKAPRRSAIAHLTLGEEYKIDDNWSKLKKERKTKKNFVIRKVLSLDCVFEEPSSYSSYLNQLQKLTSKGSVLILCVLKWVCDIEELGGRKKHDKRKKKS